MKTSGGRFPVRWSTSLGRRNCVRCSTRPRTVSDRASRRSARSTTGKAAFAVAVTDDLVERFSAVDLVRVGVEALGGKGGGGRPDMAQGGGPDGAKIQSACRGAFRRVTLPCATATDFGLAPRGRPDHPCPQSYWRSAALRCLPGPAHSAELFVVRRRLGWVGIAHVFLLCWASRKFMKFAGFRVGSRREPDVPLHLANSRRVAQRLARRRSQFAIQGIRATVGQRRDP